MPLSSSCVKFALLGVVALTSPATQLKLLIGIALPIPEMIEFAFAYLQGKSEKRALKELTLDLAGDVSRILGDDPNAEAVMLLAERCIGSFGLSDQEFANLGLDPQRAANAVFAGREAPRLSPKQKWGSPQALERRDYEELKEQTHRVLAHFYKCLAAHPLFLRDFAPKAFQALYKTEEDRHNATQDAIRKLERTITSKTEKPSYSLGMPSSRSEFYEVRCPPTIQEYDSVIGWTDAVFQEAEVIDSEADRKAFLRNPYSMVVLANYLGEIVGYIDIYHLPDAVLDAVLSDTTGEVEIDPALCLDYEQARACTRAYVATIMVRNHAGMSTRLRSRALIYGMMEFILKHQFHGVESFELWSIGSTTEGEATLNELGFEYDHRVVVAPGEEPKPAFRKRFTKDELISEQAEFFSKNDLRNVVLSIPDHP